MQIIRTPSKFWSVHTHSRYSVNDALPEVEEIVKRVKKLNQPAVALTDHGNMAGSVELYQECMKEGLVPFPGSELYFVPDLAQYKADYANKNKKAERFHLGVVAYTSKGYENLVRLSTLSHQNHFHKPTLDYSLLSELAEDGRTEGLAVTTGCFFGYAVQTLVHRGEAALKQYLATLESWFPDSVYVEIQNHNIDHDGEWNDDVVADALVQVADQIGFPVVIGQDSHYIYPKDREDHEALKRLVAFGPDPDEAVFPGDGFHLADDRWIADHHSGDRLARGLEGLADLLSRHTLTIPVLDHYSYSVPQVVPNPEVVMEQKIQEGIDLKEATTSIDFNRPKYSQKLSEEIAVITDSGMASYMMLVAMVTDYMRENGIVFQTRGSAAGSLVCYLLGISSVDPLKWDLRFERFLSRDRTKPPDIDLDLQHDRRQEVIDYLDTKFTAHQIGSWGVYSVGDQKDEDEEKGSLLVRYWSTRGKQEELDDDRQIPPADWAMLKRLSDRHLYKGMGTNAAGVVLTSTPEEFNRLVPLAYMPRAGTKSGFVTQYNKDGIEALGLVKLDVLGSKTLTVLDLCMKNLGMDVSNLEDIEFRDVPTYRLISSGETAGVFQLEGKTSKWGCKDLQPNNIKDVIAAMALFRTAAMSTGGTKAYIKRKHRKEPVPERHELIMRVTKPTYGVMLYQEQVIDVLRELGMEPEELTDFLKAVKASNKEIAKAKITVQKYQEWINDRCTKIGMDDGDREFLDSAIAGFAEYGFNRAHATVYGITAYRCAYLAARHPVEFHAGLLAVAAEGDRDKHDGYIRVARKRGVRVLKPDLNKSGPTYTVDAERGAILKGLVTIDGVGLTTAEVIAKHAPYRSVRDLVERTPRRPVSGGADYDGSLGSLIGVLAKLRDQGLLDVLERAGDPEQGAG